MYKPQLKRPSASSLASTSPSAAPFQTITEINFAQEKEMALIPEAFFEQCRSGFFRRVVPGLTGVINTCEYGYPKVVQDEISGESAGNVEYGEGLFCFYKEKNAYFWQYEDRDYSTPRKLLKQTFNEPITAVTYKIVQYADFGDRAIRLVAVAFGQVVKFFRLRNFQKQYANCLPVLEDVMVHVYSPDVVTHMLVNYEQSPDADYAKNSLSIVFGDANGNLLLFDFVTKRKFIVDSLQDRIKRNMQKQNYGEIIQMLRYKDFIFCLVNRHYERNSAWKVLQKLLRSPQAEIENEQKLQIYKIESVASNTNIFGTQVYASPRIAAFKKYAQYTLSNITNKIRSSFIKYFEVTGDKTNRNDLGFIESMTLERGYVQLMFKSGQSILVDQDISFAGPPLNRIRKPLNLSVMCSNPSLSTDEAYEQDVLIKSLGSNLILFEGFLACQSGNQQYFTPFSLKQPASQVRSLHCLAPTKRVLLGHRSLTVAELMTPRESILLYCGAMVQVYPHRRYAPQMRKFEQKIDKIIEWFGETEVLVMLVELMMENRMHGAYKLNARLDLFELAVRELATDDELSYKEAQKSYEQNLKNYIKSTQFILKNQTLELMWKVVFKAERKKVEMPANNEWKVHTIESICLAFQILISETYRDIRHWTARGFCLHRDRVYRIISFSKILSEVINEYVQKQVDSSSRRNTQIKDYFGNDTTSMPTQKTTQSLKIKFCQITNNVLEKLVLLLKVYDFVCEMDLHGTSIPKFADLIFNFGQVHRIEFANTILKTLGINNQALIDSLIVKIPELQLEKVRRFNFWKSMHGQSQAKPEDPNKTFDNSFEEPPEQISDILNEVHYKQIESYYLQLPHKQPRLSSPVTEPDNQRVQNIQFVNGVTFMLKANLKKIQELRNEEVQTINIMSLYKKSSEDYFGTLEMPSLARKASHILKQIEFFTRCCEGLIDQAFDRHSRGRLGKQHMHSLIDSIKATCSLEVRKKLEKCLEKSNLTELLASVSRRQLFSPQPSRTSCEAEDSNGSLTRQLAHEIARKYA